MALRDFLPRFQLNAARQRVAAALRRIDPTISQAEADYLARHIEAIGPTNESFESDSPNSTTLSAPAERVEFVCEVLGPVHFESSAFYSPLFIGEFERGVSALVIAAKELSRISVGPSPPPIRSTDSIRGAMTARFRAAA